jgi:hypothetical protein
MLPAGSLEAEAPRLSGGNIVGASYHKLYTRSSAPEDGRNYRPKHVELIGIINKSVSLHLLGFLLNHVIMLNTSYRIKDSLVS